MMPISHAKTAIKKYPAKITAKEFLAMIAENPSVFEHWETPLEITEFVDCKDSPITHLSPHLTFSGRNIEGDTAYFDGCRHLQNATGTFHGYVDFGESGIESIENLTVTQPDNEGTAAKFTKCRHLKVATGTFHGFANFRDCGIESIENLTITQTDNNGNAANFRACFNLKIATGNYPGFVNFEESGIESIQNLTVRKPNKIGAAAYFYDCLNLKMATGTYAGFVCFENSGIQQIKELTITNADGDYARFTQCYNLHTLEGWDLSKQIEIEPEKLEVEKKRRASLEKFVKETTLPPLPFL